MKEISVSELKNWRDEGVIHQLIDVREEFEYDAANIQGELIPMGSIPDHLSETELRPFPSVHAIVANRPFRYHACRWAKNTGANN